MNRFFALACVACTAFSAFAHASIPGFEDPAVLERVMKGEFVAEDITATKKEFRSIFRLFVPKASPDAWLEVATNHANYPNIIPSVQTAETTKVNADRTEFEYKMDIVVSVGPFKQHIYPEARQTVQRAPDAVSEAKVTNVVTNYKDMIALNSETTRLIPYQGGILVHDDVSFALVKENNQSSLIKSKLKEQAQGVLEGFRNALTP